MSLRYEAKRNPESTSIGFKSEPAEIVGKSVWHMVEGTPVRTNFFIKTASANFETYLDAEPGLSNLNVGERVLLIVPRDNNRKHVDNRYSRRSNGASYSSVK